MPSSSDLAERAAPSPASRWAIPALLGFVAVALVLLLLVPFVVNAEGDVLREQIEAEVAQAMDWSGELRRDLALAAAAARGYLVSGDSLFATDFREAETGAASALDRLAAMAPSLGPDVPDAVSRVEEAWSAWDTPRAELFNGTVDREGAARDLPLSQARYDALLTAAESLDDGVRAAGAVRAERIRALERTQVFVFLVLIPLALFAAGAVAWLGRRLYLQADALAAREAELRALADDLEHRVAQRTRDVRRLSVAVVETQRREQARIAQLLHDHLQQLLYGARMRLGFLDRDDDDVQAIDRILTDAIQAARTLAVELAPPVLREEGLAAALHWLAAHVERVNGLVVTVEADGAASEADCAAAHVQDLLFQLTRELLFNVVKHAGVDRAAVSLCRDGDALVLTVTDAGSGFDAGAAREGYGLGSVRERVALVEGKLDMTSTPGRGTRVRVAVPLQSGGPVQA